jgi:eukaryotic-like serine/threonine-protein kinase
LTLSPGTRLGPYEITALLGVGGIGIYRPADTILKRQLAPAVLPIQVADDPKRVAHLPSAKVLLNWPALCRTN